jgi:hypothetical protein
MENTEVSHRRVYSARSISDKPFDRAVKKLRAREMTFIVCLLCAKLVLGLISLSSCCFGTRAVSEGLQK